MNRPSTLWSSASPRPVPAAISAMLPPGSGEPCCSTCTSDDSSTGTEYAIACRSFSSTTRPNGNRDVTLLASTFHGTLVSSAA